MKTFFYIVLALHALIHLIGFAKGQGWSVQGLQLPISKTAALFWLLTFLLFIGWGISSALQQEYSWILGGLAIVVSQIVLFTVWSDAKWGTIPNLILLIMCWIQFSEYRFNRQWVHDTELLKQELIQVELHPIDSLPKLVQRWYHRAMAERTTPIQGGTIEQSLEMKLQPDQTEFNAATAIQLTRIYPPAFSWKVDVPYKFGLHLFGRDDYREGKGSMLITLNHLFPVVHATGPQLDEGTLQRYLGELVWFPPLARSSHITWEAIDDFSVKAIFRYQGVEGSGKFYFNEEGDFKMFVAQRYYEPEKKYYDWVLEVQKYGSFDGVRIPTEMRATWKLPNRDWTWLKLKLKNITFW